MATQLTWYWPESLDSAVVSRRTVLTVIDGVPSPLLTFAPSTGQWTDPDGNEQRPPGNATYAADAPKKVQFLIADYSLDGSLVNCRAEWYGRPRDGQDVPYNPAIPALPGQCTFDTMTVPD